MVSSPAVRGGVLVIFGGSGDLAQRMLLPSLYFLELEGLLPPALQIVGVARAEKSREAYVEQVREAVRLRAQGHFSEEAWGRLAERLRYCAADVSSPEAAGALKAAIDKTSGVLVYYLATSPSLYGAICETLKRAGLATPDSRVVLEKPLGRSLETSRAINDVVGAVFSEDRVFRIDHYLGKETVQNLIALRFGNALFEPLWNSQAIDHVQITVAETEGVGERWPYYDEYGALRDMVQNHILQLLCLVAMEPPASLDPDAVRDEKVKVLRSLRSFSGHNAQQLFVKGQYAAGVVDGTTVKAYGEERGAPTDTETFVALRVDVDNWRWAGVPFFLRTGKRMPERRTQIYIQFKPVPHSIFNAAATDELITNRLVIDLQPQEDISLLLMNKAPGLDSSGMRLQPLPLSLSLTKALGEGARRRIAYERLILDVLHGNRTLFVRRDEVELAWAWIDDVAEAWAGVSPKAYPAGSWGPPGAFGLIERAGWQWND